jgi:hypothetical protein
MIPHTDISLLTLLSRKKEKCSTYKDLSIENKTVKGLVQHSIPPRFYSLLKIHEDIPLRYSVISINSTTYFLPKYLAGKLSATVGLSDHITNTEAFIQKWYNINLQNIDILVRPDEASPITYIFWSDMM